jgi:hypothetical protein
MTTVNAAVLLGTALAILVTVFGLRRMRRSFPSEPSNATLRRTANALPAALAVIAFPFAWWLGFILGGNFGGGVSAWLAERLGGEAVLVPVGIGLGIFLITATLCLAVAVVGLLLVQGIIRNGTGNKLSSPR